MSKSKDGGSWTLSHMTALQKFKGGEIHNLIEIAESIENGKAPKKETAEWFGESLLRFLRGDEKKWKQHLASKDAWGLQKQR